jgi:hypothetical protein
MMANGTFRSDGLDNPCSPNSRSLTWHDAENLAEECDAVVSYDDVPGGVEVTWSDGTKNTYWDPTGMYNAVRDCGA